MTAGTADILRKAMPAYASMDPRVKSVAGVDELITRIYALEEEFAELRKPFGYSVGGQQCLNEGMIEASFTGILRNLDTIRRNAVELRDYVRPREQRAEKLAAE